MKQSRYQVELRFARHYLARLRRAGELYDQGGEALKRGLTEFDTEWKNLEAAQSWAVAHATGGKEVDEICSAFPDVAPRLLDLRQHPEDRIRWLEAGLSAALRRQDRAAEGRHINHLALANSHLGRLVQAIDFFKTSLEIFQLISNRRAQSEVLANMGYVYAQLGELPLAITVSEQAKSLAQTEEDRRSETIALLALGQTFYLMREFRKAIEFYEQSSELAHSIGYSAAENLVLNSLGKTWAILNKPTEAIKFYEQALGIAREIGDRQGQRDILGNLGQAYHLLNDLMFAIEMYRSALTIATEIGGDPMIEAELLNNLGDAFLDLGDPKQALNYYQQRVTITVEFRRRRARNAEQLFHDRSLQARVNTDVPEISTSPEDPEERYVRWLHLSDFHFGGSYSHRYDQGIVIESLLKDVKKQIESANLQPDFIAVTGDLALSGKTHEYAMVSNFFDELLAITNLSPQRLFIVPGNHDVDRDLITRAALSVSKDLTDRQSTNDILGSPDDRRIMLNRFKGYSGFFNEYFRGHLTFDDEQFFYAHDFEVSKSRVAILGLNSSWLSASDEDEIRKLVIGERQTRAALKAAEAAKPILKIALLHHPSDWIRGFDQSDSVNRLLTECDFVLHGHLHKSASTLFTNPDGSALVIAGGACYASREYPNSYNFVQVDLSSKKGQIHFREYVDPGNYWAKGVRLYKNAPDGMYEFEFPAL